MQEPIPYKCGNVENSCDYVVRCWNHILTPFRLLEGTISTQHD